MTKHLQDFFKALSDNARIKILGLLVMKEELSCKELSEQIELSQPTLSHHFKKLVDAEIIAVRKKGVSHYYKINQSVLKKRGIDLKRLLAE